MAGEANAAGTGTYILALTAAGPRSSERVAAIGAGGRAPDKNADNNAISRDVPKKTPKPPPENTRITTRRGTTPSSRSPPPSTGLLTVVLGVGTLPAGFDRGVHDGTGRNRRIGYVLTKLEIRS